MVRFLLYLRQLRFDAAVQRSLPTQWWQIKSPSGSYLSLTASSFG